VDTGTRGHGGALTEATPPAALGTEAHQRGWKRVLQCGGQTVAVKWWKKRSSAAAVLKLAERGGKERWWVQ
jgi:hypothetical protein